jgi:hypothetical protein
MEYHSLNSSKNLSVTLSAVTTTLALLPVIGHKGKGETLINP